MYYGFIPRPVSYAKPVEPIDALILYAEAHYLDWSLHNPKFMDAFKKFYPDWAKRLGSIAEILIDELEEAINRKTQPVALLDKLIKFTINSRSACLEELEIDLMIDDDQDP
jgi:hypothetical protein